MNRIKEILKEKGITQIELAERLGVSRSSIVKTIVGNPSEETLERIASALDVPMWQLFESPENIPSNNTSITCPKCGTEIKIKVE